MSPRSSRERSTRSVVKTITWRIVATATTFSIVYLLTGQLVLALEVGGLEAVAKLVLYYLHERGWSWISWGSRDHVQTDAPLPSDG